MKRKKIFALIAMCGLCFAVLVFGIYAAITVVFNLNTNITFNPEGVYVDISGQIYRGEDYSSLEPLKIDPSYTLDKTSNYIVTESGEISGNFAMESWNPSEVQFTPYQPFIQYEIVIKNNSLEPISLVPTSITGVPANVEVIEESSATLYIEPNDEKVYRLNLELKDIKNVVNATIGINFDIKKVSEIPTTEDWMQITEIEGVRTLTGVQNAGSITTAPVLRIPETVSAIASLEYENNPETANPFAINIFKDLPENIKYIIVPENINIKSYSFANSKFQGIGLPNSALLGEYAVFVLSNLNSLDMPDDFTNGIFEALFSMSNIINVDIKNFDILPDDIFSMASKLEKVTLSNSLISIGNYSFQETNIKSIVLPKTIKSIGMNAFNDCKNLKNLEILGSPTIEDDSFNDCEIDKIIYEYEDELLSFKDGELTVKFVSKTNATIDDFKKFQFITKTLIFEEGYTIVGESTKEIDNMNSLRNLVLPNSLNKIDSSFNKCKNLETVYIPKNVTSISWSSNSTDEAFNDCPKVKFIVDSENTEFSSDNFGSIYNSDKTILYKLPEFIQEYTLPDSVQTIKSFAFYNSNLNSLIITSNVKTVEADAFKFLDLKNITIPNNTDPKVFTTGAFGQISLSLTLYDSPDPFAAFNDININYTYYGTNYNFINGELTITSDTITSLPRELDSLSALIQKVNMPSTVTDYNMAFSLSNLSEINYSFNGTGYTYENGVITINADTDEANINSVDLSPFVFNFSLIKVVKIASSVTKINLSIFPQFFILRKFIVPETIEQITGTLNPGVFPIEIEIKNSEYFDLYSFFTATIAFPHSIILENESVIENLNSLSYDSMLDQNIMLMLMGLSVINTKIYVTQELSSSIFEEKISDKDGYYLYEVNDFIKFYFTSQM